MPGPLDDVCLARLPAEALPLLAAVRTAPQVRVWRDGDFVWLRWELGNDAILRCVLPIAGVELFARRGLQWYKPGQALPAFEVPDGGNGESLARQVVPAPLDPTLPHDIVPDPIRLILVPDDRPRPTTALRCEVARLAKWADDATSRQLAAVSAAICAGEAVLLGDRLPPLSGATRFWGRSAFVPLGFRPEPELPESAVRAALELADDEVVLLEAERAEVIVRSSFARLTRAAARLAVRS